MKEWKELLESADAKGSFEGHEDGSEAMDRAGNWATCALGEQYAEATGGGELSKNQFLVRGELSRCGFRDDTTERLMALGFEFDTVIERDDPARALEIYAEIVKIFEEAEEEKGALDELA